MKFYGQGSHFGGHKMKDDFEKQECVDHCLHEKKCVGVDYNVWEKSCWTHVRIVDYRYKETACCDHFRKLATCECKKYDLLLHLSFIMRLGPAETGKYVYL